MVQGNLVDADNDGTLDNIASTYNHDSESLSMGVASPGPRVLNFAPLLRLNTIPLNPLIKKLLEICEQVLKSPVEMEFAVTFNPHRFNLLQVRAMVAPTGRFLVEENEMVGENVIAASRTALGNGAEDTITHIVYVKPNAFNLSVSEAVVPELEQINHKMLAEGKPYVLVVLGRLGTNIPWLGIPAGWGQVSGARIIVEAAQEMVNVELSQGSHYFHNIINLGVKYFCMPVSNIYNVDWNWLDDQTVVDECEYLRHIELPRPLRIRVDGQSGRGVIYKS